LRVELGDPPVVFARRVGGDVCEGFGIGRPVELENVEARRCDSGGDGWLGGIGRDESDALNFDVIFSDDAGGRCFGGKRAGGTCCAFDVEKRDALSIRRESRRVDVAVEFGEADGGFAIEMREKEIGLPAGIGTVGEEGDGGGVGRPDEIGGVAGLAGRYGGDGLALDEIVERGEANLAGLKPDKALGIGRDGDLGEGAGAILAGENFVELDAR
jgi:hypothetical protein